MDDIPVGLKKIQNTSGLVPLGHAVLLRMYEVKSESGIIIPEAVKKTTVLAEMRGIVVAIGSECWKEEQGRRCHLGDHVLFTKYAGFSAKGPTDGLLYRVINDRDIFIRIDAVEEEVDNG